MEIIRRPWACVRCGSSNRNKNGKCKSCSNGYVKKWRLENHEKNKAYGKKWRDANPDKCYAKSKKWNSSNPEKRAVLDRRKLMKKYGLSLEDFNDMLKAHEYRCAICKSDKSGGQGAFHVDHDHFTGKVRGILCHSCNICLGHYEKNQKPSGLIIEPYDRYLSSPKLEDHETT